MRIKLEGITLLNAAYLFLCIIIIFQPIPIAFYVLVLCWALGNLNVLSVPQNHCDSLFDSSLNYTTHFAGPGFQCN